jgi:hypothetical protein
MGEKIKIKDGIIIHRLYIKIKSANGNWY